MSGAEQSYLVFDLIWLEAPPEGANRFNVIVPADVMAMADNASEEEEWEKIVAGYIKGEIFKRFGARPIDFRFA